MSYELLRDCGLLPRPGQVVFQPRKQSLTSEEELVREQMVRMAYVAFETAKTYGGKFPRMDKGLREANQDVNSKKKLCAPEGPK